MTDREKAGLRGPVRNYSEKCQYHDGYTCSTESTYDLDGRLLQIRVIHPDSSEWVSARTYDCAGHLTKIISGQAGSHQTETIYSYDGNGRIIEIRTVAQPEPPQHRASSVALDFAAEGPHDELPIPHGGSLKIIYDETGRPIEIHTFGMKDQLLSKSIRSYDAGGRLIEQNQILENPIGLLTDRMPAGAIGEMTEGQRDRLSRVINTIFAGKRGSGASYFYDADGRLTEVRQRTFILEIITTIRYNDHGDRVEARATFSPNNAIPPSGGRIDQDGNFLPSQPETDSPSLANPFEGLGSPHLHSYDYEGYDKHDNWIKRTKTAHVGDISHTIVAHRSLSYF